MMNDFREQVERCALLSLEKSLRLESVIGGLMLELDLDAGLARFPDRIEVPFQVLGTESDNTLSWLWGWADEQTEVPESLLRSAREMRAWLDRSGFASLTRPSLDLDEADGLLLSLVASEVCKASAFLRDHYEGGALFLLLYHPEIDRQPGFDRAGLTRSLRDLVEQYDLNARALVTSYVEGRGLPHAIAGNALNAQLENGERLVAEFDSVGKLATLNGEPLL